MSEVFQESSVVPTSLRRNWRFQTLWIGGAAAALGFEIADLAYPLAILALTGSPAWAAAFGAVQLTGAVLFGLPAGAVVDRYDRRRAFVAVETVRAGVVLSIALAVVAHRLTVAHLLIAAAILGAGQALGAARTLLVRAIVPPGQLSSALTQEEARSAVVVLIGPALGGALYATGHPLPFFIAAAGLLVSALCAFVVRTRSHVAGTPPVHGTFSGIAALWQRRTIRMVLVAAVLLNMAGTVLPLAVIVIATDQRINPHTIGLIMSAAGVGLLAGAALTTWLHKHMRPGNLLVAVLAWTSLSCTALAVEAGPWWAAGALALALLGIPALRVLADVLIIQQVPDAIRGRALTGLNTIVTAGMPASLLTGGLLLQYAGPAPTLGLIAAILIATAIACAASSTLRAA